MGLLTNRQEVEAECKRLGVVLMPHSDAAPWANVAAWANLASRLRGDPILFSSHMWMTLYPRILHTEETKDPFGEWRLICHELVHWQRQRDRGLWSWVWKYATDQHFRFAEEGIAYLQDLRLGRLQVPFIVRSLRNDYGITKVSEAEMFAWFEANRVQ